MLQVPRCSVQRGFLRAADFYMRVFLGKTTIYNCTLLSQALETRLQKLYEFKHSVVLGLYSSKSYILSIKKNNCQHSLKPPLPRTSANLCVRRPDRKRLTVQHGALPELFSPCAFKKLCLSQ